MGGVRLLPLGFTLGVGGEGERVVWVGAEEDSEGGRAEVDASVRKVAQGGTEGRGVGWGGLKAPGSRWENKRRNMFRDVAR